MTLLNKLTCWLKKPSRETVIDEQISTAIKKMEKLIAEKPKAQDIHWAKIYFNWTWNGVGFGETFVGVDKETGKIYIDAECMGKERARQLLYALVDKLVDEAEIR